LEGKNASDNLARLGETDTDRGVISGKNSPISDDYGIMTK